MCQTPSFSNWNTSKLAHTFFVFIVRHLVIISRFQILTPQTKRNRTNCQAMSRLHPTGRVWSADLTSPLANKLSLMGLYNDLNSSVVIHRVRMDRLSSMRS